MKPNNEDTRFKIADARFAAGAAIASSLPAPTRPEIAFCGRSNVGKSSLLNMLVSRKNLVRTSRTPGCTRQINLFDVDVVGKTKWNVCFVDLPGYGYAARSRDERSQWQKMVEGYFSERASWRGVVLLMDVRRGLEDEEEELAEYLESLPRDPTDPLQIMVVATKLDRLARNEQKPALDKFEKRLRTSGLQSLAGRVLGSSAETGEG
ncbi:MAG: ribosome biogenesis GTP-binding protein YihA/YsxC, partial [Polyangiaceae bacterium]